MNSRVRIVRRNQISERPTTDSKATTEVLRNREMVAVVKSWIDEFKLRSRREPRVTLQLPHRA